MFLTRMTLQNDPSTTVSCPVLHLRPSGVGLVPSWKAWRSKEQQATLDPWSLQTSGCYVLLLRGWCHAVEQIHSWRWWRWHPKEVQFPRMKMRIMATPQRNFVMLCITQETKIKLTSGGYSRLRSILCWSYYYLTLTLHQMLLLL